MTLVKYSKQEMMVVETMVVLAEVRIVKLWMYSEGINIIISQWTKCRLLKKEKKKSFYGCFMLFFKARQLGEWSSFLLKCGIPQQVWGRLSDV